MRLGKLSCDGCGKETNSIHSHKYRDKFLCSRCYIKANKGKTIGHSNPQSFEKASTKIYTIRGYKIKKKGKIRALCSFPSVLIGRKFKLNLIDK